MFLLVHTDFSFIFIFLKVKLVVTGKASTAQWVYDLVNEMAFFELNFRIARGRTIYIYGVWKITPSRRRNRLFLKQLVCIFFQVELFLCGVAWQRFQGLIDP